MVPQLRQRARSNRANSSSGSFSVRWTPALVDPKRVARTAERMPGSVRVLDRNVDARALTRSYVEAAGLAPKSIGELLGRAAGDGVPQVRINAVRSLADYRDPELAKRTRRAFMERYGDTDALVCTAHFPLPSAGRIVAHGNAFRFDFDDPDW